MQALAFKHEVCCSAHRLEINLLRIVCGTPCFLNHSKMQTAAAAADQPCRVSNFVSRREALSCSDAGCLTPCHLTLVSSSCPFFDCCWAASASTVRRRRRRPEPRRARAGPAAYLRHQARHRRHLHPPTPNTASYNDRSRTRGLGLQWWRIRLCRSIFAASTRFGSQIVWRVAQMWVCSATVCPSQNSCTRLRSPRTSTGGRPRPGAPRSRCRPDGGSDLRETAATSTSQSPEPPGARPASPQRSASSWSVGAHPTGRRVRCSLPRASG